MDDYLPNCSNRCIGQFAEDLDLAQPHFAKGRLKRVLEEWCQPYSGYHLYYPSRRQASPAFALLVDALRYRG